jgi:glutamate synthase domain-containing protein 3
VATQDPELRRRFEGEPEHVVNYLFMVAEEARRVMASLGVRSIAELIGRTDLLVPDESVDHWKGRGFDLRPLLELPPGLDPDAPRHCTRRPDPVLYDSIDVDLLQRAQPAIENGEHVRVERQIENKNRAVGGLLSGEIARRHGEEGLPEGSIEVLLHGSAGQSFGAWLAAGVTLELVGDANDYTGKGMSGGTLVVRPSDEAGFRAEDNAIVGNTVLYGATSGKAFFRGLAGERFGVRNSGVVTVVEGVGDHGCEYMTGGRVIVLGPTGLNFAAGMSGGIAYVYDEDGRFASRCNTAMVSLGRVVPVAEQEQSLERAVWHREQADETLLKSLITDHHQWTGSLRAREILDHWSEALPKFVKVFPNEYKRALAEISLKAMTALGEIRATSEADDAIAKARTAGKAPKITAPK